jgi:two-component system, NarL family, nitrate/nitrite response regulator NarL
MIDDDPIQIELVQRGLSRDGFEVYSVMTLSELAQETAVKQFAPQIVLIDLNMPDEPDDRTIALTRELAPGARVMLYSAWDDSKLRRSASKLGADGFISKNESVVALGQRLHDLQRR